MSLDVIVDIETLGVSANSVILTIGAIKFKRCEEIQELEKYEKLYIRINIESCIEKGLKTEKSTIDWWNSQSQLVRYETVYNPERFRLEESLQLLSNFIKDCKCIWSQGSFDSIILENAYKKCNIEVPWKFWQIRDSRTLFDICKIDLKSIDYKSDEVHNALIDCYRQLIGTYKALKKIP